MLPNSLQRKAYSGFLIPASVFHGTFVASQSVHRLGHWGSSENPHFHNNKLLTCLVELLDVDVFIYTRHRWSRKTHLNPFFYKHCAPLGAKTVIECLTKSNTPCFQLQRSFVFIENTTSEIFYGSSGAA